MRQVENQQENVCSLEFEFYVNNFIDINLQIKVEKKMK